MKVRLLTELAPGTMFKDAFGALWMADTEGNVHAIATDPFRTWTADKATTFEADYGPFTLMITKDIIT